MTGRDDGDRPSWSEREKLSFSELDRRRREGRDSGGSGSPGAGNRERTEAETKQYLKSLDNMFGKQKGGGESDQLAAKMRDAHGTPALAEACRAYRDAAGVPEDSALLALFLDVSDDNELVVQGLDMVRVSITEGRFKLSSGLRSQLRTLAQSADDAVAEGAEEILEGA